MSNFTSFRILASILPILASISPILSTETHAQQAEARRGARAEAATSAKRAEHRRDQAMADNERYFGDYVLYYSVFYSSFLSPETAEAVGITRARNRAVVNVAVRRVEEDAQPGGAGADGTEGQEPPSVAGAATQPKPEFPGMSGEAAAAELSGTVSDLVHRRPLRFQEVRELGAVYYLAPLRFGHRDTLYFDVRVLAEGAKKPYRLKFERRLYVEGK